MYDNGVNNLNSTPLPCKQPTFFTFHIPCIFNNAIATYVSVGKRRENSEQVLRFYDYYMPNSIKFFNEY